MDHLVGTFPYFPPQQLKVEDAASKLLAWLHSLYSSRYEETTSASVSKTDDTAPMGRPVFEDRVFLNRMLGLSNLYYIDPEDQEILQELREVRLKLFS